MSKHYLKHTLFVLSINIIAGCGGGGGGSITPTVPQYSAPGVDFSYGTSSSGIVFNSTSTNSNNIASYEWTVDNTNSSLETFTLTTYNASTYIVTLTITDTEGNTYSIDKNISFDYGSDGYDSSGYDSNGYNAQGYDSSGYDINGYDINGYNSSGYDVNGYDSSGYNSNGYDSNGYNSLGYDSNGYNAQGYDSSGYDINGYDINGYDSSDYDTDGYTVDGFNVDGDARIDIIDGINYTQGTRSTIPTTIVTTEYSNANYLDLIHADEAYSRGWTGEGVTVAVIDSGIDSDHHDLNDNLIGTYSTITDNSTEDVLGHGTHVAGIIAAERNGLGVHGLAYNSKIISIKAFQDSGSVFYADLGEAAVIAANQGAKVANISAAGSTWFTEYFGYIVDDFRTALDADTSLVFSAGNNALGDAEYPAKLPSIIEYADLLTKDGAYFSVGAVGPDNVLASYSNEAGVAANWHIMAPGGDDGERIYSTYLNGGYSYMQGTSMAAPVVTASIAIMAQRFPYLRGSEIQDILFATTTDLGAAGVDEVYGQGLLNFEKAMQPIGDIVIPTGASVASTTTSASTTSLVTSSSMNSQAIASALTDVMVLDDYKRDYYTDLGSSVVASQAKMDLFDYYKIGIGKTFFVGIDPITQSASIGTYYNEFDISFTRTNDLFGTRGSGVLSLSNAKTNYLSVGYPITRQWKLATTYGNGTAKGSGLISDISTVQSISAKAEYSDGNFSLGLKSPEKIISGTMSLSVPTSRTIDGTVNYENKTIAMNGDNQVEVYAKYKYMF